MRYIGLINKFLQKAGKRKQRISSSYKLLLFFYKDTTKHPVPFVVMVATAVLGKPGHLTFVNRTFENARPSPSSSQCCHVQKYCVSLTWRGQLPSSVLWPFYCLNAHSPAAGLLKLSCSFSQSWIRQPAITFWGNSTLSCVSAGVFLGNVLSAAGAAIILSN